MVVLGCLVPRLGRISVQVLLEVVADLVVLLPLLFLLDYLVRHYFLLGGC
jgi:hypothetical protein